MLGRRIENPAVVRAKQHILNNTNRDGFVSLNRVNEINNRSARQRALREMGYLIEQQTWGNIIGYRRP